MENLEPLSPAAEAECVPPTRVDLVASDIIENRTFAELTLGDSAQILRTFTYDDIELFANVSGDVNPAHLDQAYAEGTMFHGVIAHGMLGGSLFSTVLGTLLPGPGTIYLSQDLHFRRPVKPGDTLTAKVVVREMNAEKKRVVLDCVCTNQDGKEVISGTAEVIAPTEKVRRKRIARPEVSLVHHLLSAAGLSPSVPGQQADLPVSIKSLGDAFTPNPIESPHAKRELEHA